MKRKILTTLAVIAVLLIIFTLLAFNTSLKTVRYEVESDKATDEVRLVLLTDLHSCSYGENQQKLFDVIEGFEPHAVLLGGDIIDDVMPETHARSLFERAAESYNTFYVSGNHEWWSGKMTEHFSYINSLGIKSLRGDRVSLQVGESTVYICGIDDPEADKYLSAGTWENQLENAAEDMDRNAFNLLLSHRPERTEKYFEQGFDLALCGHAHGGQFRVPFLMNGFYAPNQGFLPELAGGKYEFDGKTLIVGRGLAKENTKLPRIFNRPEIVLITIKPE